MLIGVPLETAAGETRVAVTPETAKKLKAQGHTVRVQSGAGVAASATDEAYVAAGAEITDRSRRLCLRPGPEGAQPVARRAGAGEDRRGAGRHAQSLRRGRPATAWPAPG